MAEYVLQNDDGTLFRPKQTTRSEEGPPPREAGTGVWVLADPKSDVLAVPEQVKEPVAKTKARAILQGINGEADRRAKNQIRLADLLWDNDEETIKAILEELGTQAATVFALSKTSVESLGALAAVSGRALNDLIHPSYQGVPRAIEIHADGTVTLKED